jgi:hypothetical protein
LSSRNLYEKKLPDFITGFNDIFSTVKVPDINGVKHYYNTGFGMIVKNSGKVGIGITNPADILEKENT